MDDFLDAGERSGNVDFYIFHPIVILFLHFRIGEIKPLPAHIYKAQLVTSFDILIERDSSPGTNSA